MLPWGGEPIKVGHHSERRHRRDIERSHALMGRAIERSREAERLQSLADRDPENLPISADDPDAVVKLRAKLAAMEARREEIKAANRRARKAGTPAAPAYVLSNLGANIRRVRERIATLEAAAVAEVPEDIEVGAFTLTWDREENRVRASGPRPAPEARKAAAAAWKAGGFKWSRSACCWQRMASQRAWYAAKEISLALSNSLDN